MTLFTYLVYFGEGGFFDGLIFVGSAFGVYTIINGVLVPFTHSELNRKYKTKLTPIGTL